MGKTEFIDRTANKSDQPDRRRMTREEIARRYPVLIYYMQQSALLSHGEAVSAICDIQFARYMGYEPHGCEAVAHFGGAKKVVRIAWRDRHWRRKTFWKAFIGFLGKLTKRCLDDIEINKEVSFAD